MKRMMIVCFAALSVAAAQELPSWATLTLRSGKEYQKVKVTEKRADGISISHESGTARISFEDIPDATAKELGLSAEAAETAKAKKTMAEEEARKQAAVNAARFSMTARVSQVLEDGILITNMLYWTKSSDAKDAKSRNIPISSHGPAFVRWKAKGIVEGSHFQKFVVPDGEFQFVDTLGASRTVRAFRVVDGPKK